MVDEGIVDYGREKGFRQQTMDRWLQFPQTDREALLGLAKELKIGENHFRDLLDWLEEIALRDDVSLCEMLKGESLMRILSEPRLGRNDKLKRFKDELRRRRFPRLAQMEEDIRKRIQAMKLGSQIQMTFPPGLEGGTLTVQVRATSYEEFRRLIVELGGLLESEAMKEIFDLLHGREIDAGLSAP